MILLLILCNGVPDFQYDTTINTVERSTRFPIILLVIKADEGLRYTDLYSKYEEFMNYS